MSRTRAVITVVATCAVITVAYFATIPILYASDSLFGGPISSPVMATLMVVVPYVLGGIAFGLLASRHTWKPAVIAAVITTLTERAGILGLGAHVRARFRQVGADGQVYYVEGSADLVGSIQSEALPYFTWPYILLGLPASVTILVVTAYLVGNLRQLVGARGGLLAATRTLLTPLSDNRWRRWPAVLAAAVVLVLAVVAVVRATGPATVASPDPLVRAAAAAIDNSDEPVEGGQFRYIGTRLWTPHDLGGGPGRPLWLLSEYRFHLWMPAHPALQWRLDYTWAGRHGWIVGSDEQARAAGIRADGLTGWSGSQASADCNFSSDVFELPPPQDPGFSPFGGRFPDDIRPPTVWHGPCTSLGGRLVPTQAFLAELPRDPAQLLARMQRDAPDNGRSDPANLLGYAAETLRTGLVPADLRSAFYLALSRIDGLTVTEGAVDLDGRSGTGLSIDDGQTRQEIIIDPETGAYLGAREVLTSSSLDDGALPAGTVLSHSSVRTAVVNATENLHELRPPN